MPMAPSFSTRGRVKGNLEAEEPHQGVRAGGGAGRVLLHQEDGWMRQLKQNPAARGGALEGEGGLNSQRVLSILT